MIQPGDETVGTDDVGIEVRAVKERENDEYQRRGVGQKPDRVPHSAARGLRIGGWNIHGWKRNKSEAIVSLAELRLDVLVVSEPWMKSAGKVVGYRWLEFKDNRSRRAKVVMLVRQGIDAELLKGSSRRMVWVKLHDKDSRKEVVVVGGVYGYCNGKGGRKGREWWEKIESMTESVKAIGRVVLVGDFNARIGMDGGPYGEVT